MISSAHAFSHRISWSSGIGELAEAFRPDKKKNVFSLNQVFIVLGVWRAIHKSSCTSFTFGCFVVIMQSKQWMPGFRSLYQTNLVEKLNKERTKFCTSLKRKYPVAFGMLLKYLLVCFWIWSNSRTLRGLARSKVCKNHPTSFPTNAEVGL